MDTTQLKSVLIEDAKHAVNLGVDPDEFTIGENELLKILGEKSKANPTDVLTDLLKEGFINAVGNDEHVTYQWGNPILEALEQGGLYTPEVFEYVHDDEEYQDC